MDKAEDRIKKLESENNSMFFEITGIMHFIDKWLEGKELELNNVQRADIAREKALKVIEGLQKQIPKEGKWRIISNRHDTYFQCMSCFSVYMENFSSKYKEREWLEENKYCRKCGTRMKGENNDK